MEHWQFLIQKAGDSAWLPLDLRGEILEGRYRIVVRTSQTNAKVNIQTSHQFEESGVPQQHLNQRSQVTDSEGLVVVVPFTYLQPGLWTLTCSSTDLLDPESDVSPGDSRHELVQLQVLQNIEACSDWDGLDSSWVDPQTPSFPEREIAGLETTAVLEPPLQPRDIKQDNSVPSAPLPKQQAVSSIRLPTFKGQGRLSYKVSAGQVFPPQIYKSYDQAGRRAPELPVIPRSRPDPIQPEAGTDTLANSESTLPNPESGTAKSSEQATKISATFEALNLRNRFWSTLDALVTETESINQSSSDSEPSLGADLGLDTVPDHASVSSSRATSDTDPANLQGQASLDRVPSTEILPPNPDLQQQRLVNLQGLLRPESQFRPQSAITKAQSESNFLRPLSLPDPTNARLSSNPLPSLFIPPGALIAGQPVIIHVRVPEQPPSIYVKFWVNDCQTNSLLDGPRWLVDFVANCSQGVLETSTRLTIPLATREVSFEAIAINVQTQQESQVVTVKRSVVAGN